MRLQNWQRAGLGFVTSTVLALGVVFLSVQPGAAQRAADLEIHVLADGSRWLAGCVADDVAEHLIAAAGFSQNGPIFLLCVDGYKGVSKELGN